jgi:hypothetical protein
MKLTVPAATDRNLRRTIFAAVALVSFIILLGMFRRPFYTYDSYDYLDLGIHPRLGGTHSFAFGLVMLGMNRIARVLSLGSMLPLFFALNALATASIFQWIVPPAGFLASLKGQWLRIALLVAEVLLLLCLVVPAVFFLMNAVWTEMLSFLELSLFGLCVAAVLGKNQSAFRVSGLMLAGIALAFVSYHTRYLMVVTSLAAAVTGAMFWARERLGWFSGAAAEQRSSRGMAWLVALGVVSLVGMSALNRATRALMPQQTGVQDMEAAGMMVSIQCALRCNASLFKTDCSTPEGRQAIESMLCRDVIHGLVSLGPLRYPLTIGPRELLHKLGSLTTIQWVLKAPFTYLQDIHDLEMGPFEFSGETAAKRDYPGAVSAFTGVLPEDGRVGSSFLVMVNYLHGLFHELRAYHWLTAICVALSLAIILLSQDPLTVFFALNTAGVYFAFAYYNPHAPLRYLVQILVPGTVAIFRFTYERFSSSETLNRWVPLGLAVAIATGLAACLGSYPTMSGLDLPRVIPNGSTAALPRLAGNPFYALDGIGDFSQPYSKLPAMATVAVEERVTVSGWAADGASRALAGGVDVVIDGLPFVAQYHLDRPDVATYHRVPAYAKAGYELSIPASLFGLGKHSVAVRVISSGGSGYLEGPTLPFEIR